jgi:hypothetical protein
MTDSARIQRRFRLPEEPNPFGPSRAIRSKPAAEPAAAANAETKDLALVAGRFPEAGPVPGR